MSVQASAALTQDELKRQAAWKAVDYIKSGMVVGLGTGSTAAFAVERLGQLMKEGKLTNIIGVPTSIRTYEQALSLGIPLATLDEQPHLNVAIDGADEVSLVDHGIRTRVRSDEGTLSCPTIHLWYDCMKGIWQS